MTTIHAVTHTPVAFRAPPGSCDCHTHVFGPAERFPYHSERAYTPGDASLEDLDRLHAHLGIERVVLVHPSPYGTYNSIGLDALRRWGLKRARGVAVIGPVTTDAELREMDAVGMRGARVNLETAGVFEPDEAWRQLEWTARRVAPLGWHVQTFARLPVLAALAERLATLPVPLVVDHFGRADASAGAMQPGLDVLKRLIGSGRGYVKLSAAYRISTAPDCGDVAPIARSLIAENPDRLLWGTDWPHPGGAKRTGASLSEIEPFQRIDDGAALNRLADWAPDAAVRDAILVTNPARLYGF